MTIIRAEVLNLNNDKTHLLTINSEKNDEVFSKIEESWNGKWLLLYDTKGELIKKIAMRYVYAIYYSTTI